MLTDRRTTIFLKFNQELEPLELEIEELEIPTEGAE